MNRQNNKWPVYISIAAFFVIYFCFTDFCKGHPGYEESYNCYDNLPCQPSGNYFDCENSLNPDDEDDDDDCDKNSAGGKISFRYGTEKISVTDLYIPARNGVALEFTRTYLGVDGDSDRTALSYRWRSNMNNWKIFHEGNVSGGMASIGTSKGTGRRWSYGSNFEAPSGVFDSLYYDGEYPGTFVLTKQQRCRRRRSRERSYTASASRGVSSGSVSRPGGMGRVGHFGPGTECGGKIRFNQLSTPVGTGLYDADQIEMRYGDKISLGYTAVAGQNFTGSVTDCWGRRIIFQYDTDNKLLTKIYTDTSSGLPYREVAYHYDGSLRLTRVVSDFSCAPSRIMDYSYDGSGRLISIKDGEGNTVSGLNYNANGQVTRESWGGQNHDFVYDWTTAGLDDYIMENIQSSTKSTYVDRRGNTKLHYYDDSIRRMTRQTVKATINGTPTDLHTDYSYDGNYLVTRKAYPGGDQEHYSYNSKGLMTKKLIYDGSNYLTHRWEYDDSIYGNVTKEIAPLGNEYSMHYDSEGSLTRKEWPSIGGTTPVEQWEYHSQGVLTRYTDPEGVVTDYEYQLKGSHYTFVSKEIYDSTGSPITKQYAYDQLGNVTRYTDPEGNITDYEYNTYSLVTRKTEPGSHVTEYSYDNNFRLTRTDEDCDTDPSPGDSKITTNACYDVQGKVTKTEREITGGASPVYATSEYYYDADENLTRLVQKTGGAVDIATDYERDQRGLMTRMVSGDREATYKYNGNGLVTRQTDGEGNNTDYAYDGYNRVTRVTDADSHYEAIYYDKAGNVTRQSSYNSGNTLLSCKDFAYDVINRNTSIKFYNGAPAGGVYAETAIYYNISTAGKGSGPASTCAGGGCGGSGSFSNDSLGQVTKIVANCCASDMEKYYDPLGRLTLQEDPEDNKIAYYFDKNGNITMSVQQDYDGSSYANLTKLYSYDNHNLVTFEVDYGDGAAAANRITTLYAYDKMGNATRLTDGLGRYTDYLYDGLGRKTRMTENTGGIARVTDFLYNKSGLLTLQRAINTGASNQDTIYVYDAAGRLTKTVYPDGAEGTTDNILLSYDKAGNITSRRDQRGTTVKYQYNERNLLTHKFVGTEGASGYVGEKYAYDGLGRMTLAASYAYEGAATVTKSIVTNYYDSQDSLTRQSQKIGSAAARDIDYTYDPTKLHLTRMIYDDTAPITMDYAYDSADRITRIERGGTLIADYTYVGNRLNRRQLHTSAASSVTLQLNPTYDEFARITKYQNYDATNTAARAEFNYAYDKMHNVLSREYVHRTGTTPDDNFLYDTLNRLTQADYIDLESQANGYNREIFEYDALGNRLTLTAKGGTDTTAYLHNTVNELTKVAATEQMYDEAGNVTRDTDEYTYHYDHMNRLTKIKENNDADDVAEFRYDALSRRIVKIDYIAGGYPETHYYYNDQQVIEEYDWADSTETRLAYYVFGPLYVDEVIVMYNDRAGEDQDYYYAHDLIYSAAALITKTGTVVEYYEYDAYGKCTFLDSSHNALGTQASGKDNPYLFTGRRLDILDSGSLKIMYYRTRYYDTETGRFLSRDFVGYWDSMNLYEYGKSTPINRLDPYGLWSIWGCLIGECGWEPTPEQRRQLNEKFKQELWDRSNGALDGLTFNMVDLSTFGFDDVTYDPQSRGQSRCVSSCIADALVNGINPLPVAFSPFQNLGGGDEPLLQAPFSEIVPGSFNTFGKCGRRMLEMVETPGEIYLPGSAVPLRISMAEKNLTKAGKAVEKLGKALNLASYLKSLNDCRKKCCLKLW